MPKPTRIIERRREERRSPSPRRFRRDRRLDAKHWDGQEKRDMAGRRFGLERRQHRERRDTDD
ncbi:MAG: hypothetical protein QGI06_08420 [Rhodospirillales bacterium]|nr:hypothetical protein [Rhodospirillales bacterium]